MSRILGIGVCAAALAASGAQADTIYRAWNSSGGGSVFYLHDRYDGFTETGSGDEQPGSPEQSSAVAQRLDFRGTDRESPFIRLTMFEFLGGTVGGSVELDVTLELRDASGSTPGSLLWSGTSHAEFVPGGSTFRTTDVVWEPTLTLPDSVFAVVSYANIVGQGETALGLSAVQRSLSLPSVPPIMEFYTPDQAWIDSGATIRSRYLEFFVSAVPSPGALALLGLAARGRRRR